MATAVATADPAPATAPASPPPPAEPPPERRSTLEESIELSLRMADFLPVQTIRALSRKAKRGRLTAADLKTLAECKTELRRKRDELLAGAATGGERVTRGSKALAALYEVSDRTVFRWQEAGMPCQPSPNAGEPTLYDLDHVDAWLAERQGDPPDAVAIPEDFLDGDGVPTNPKARLLHYNAEFRMIKTRLAEMELSVKVGELVPAADVERKSLDKIVAIKRAFLGVPTKVAMQCVSVLRVDSGRARDVAAIIKAEIEDAIRLHLAPRGGQPAAGSRQSAVDEGREQTGDLPGQGLLFEEPA